MEGTPGITAGVPPKYELLFYYFRIAEPMVPVPEIRLSITRFIIETSKLAFCYNTALNKC